MDDQLRIDDQLRMDDQLRKSRARRGESPRQAVLRTRSILASLSQVEASVRALWSVVSDITRTLDDFPDGVQYAAENAGLGEFLETIVPSRLDCLTSIISECHKALETTLFE